MYTIRELTRECKKHGFALTNKGTLSRYIGDGILQQIYTGERDQICIGLTSMYADLPDIFWDSKVPFTTYSPRNLLGLPAPRLCADFHKEDDIASLMDGGLSALARITSQEELVQFAVSTDAIEAQSTHMHSKWLWGAFAVCGRTNELVYEVCYHYTEKCEGFRRAKSNKLLLTDQKYAEYLSKCLSFGEELSELSDLWHALLLDNRDFLNQYIHTNFTRNLEQIKKHNIPILE